MVLIALIAVGLHYWKWTQQGLEDAWYGAVRMHVGKGESLEGVLKRLKVLSVSSRLPNGLPIYVDPIGLQEAEKTLAMAPGSDFDARGEPLNAFLNRVLEPMGLACKLQNGLVTVTSKESLDVPLAP
jgi:hypothetical protein